MMVSPEIYIREVEGKSYLELIKERDKLLRFVRCFEKKEMAGGRSDSAWHGSPSPAVRYQVYLEYLSVLCNLMQKRYNDEYVWEDRTLKQDMEELDDGP